jgi:protein-tyrosine phosphatase
MQLTANSLTGYWGSACKRMGLELLKEGLVHFLATDAHDAKERAPVLSSALKAAARVIGEDEAMKLVRDNPGALFD